MAAGATRLAGVIGWPVAHSLSPALHQAAFDAAGFDAVSVALPVEAPALPQALASLAAMDALGVSVTMPHKHAVAALATSVDPLVQRLGAANCLTFTEGAIHATSTDGRGFLDALLDVAAFEPQGQRCVVLGAGGAAVAIAVALADAGASVQIVARNQRAAADLVQLSGGDSMLATMADVAGAALIVNATPLGMEGTAFAHDLAIDDPSVLHAGQVVFDTIYHPRRTPLLAAAAAVGAQTIGGLSMLVHQARHQLEGWLGSPVDVEVLWEAVGGRQREGATW